MQSCPNVYQRVFTVLRFFTVVPLLLLVVFTATPAFAAINQTINFQGKLVDSNGLNAADGTQYELTFKLYNVSSSGSPIWTEVQGSVSVTSGIFQVQLGSVTPLTGVDFNNSNLYLGITVSKNGTGGATGESEMTPRVQFTAVPYAFNAGSLSGVVATQSATGFTLTGGYQTPKTLTLNDNITIGLTITPTAANALTVQSNGANGLTLDTGGAAAIGIGASANAITIGNNTFANNTAVTITTGGTGIVTIGSNAGTGNVLIQPNAGGKAALVVDDKGVGDLFTASASGTTKFVVTNGGNLRAVAGAQIQPLTDSTTALQIANAGGTPLVNFDTTNSFIKLGTGTTSYSGGTCKGTGVNAACAPLQVVTSTGNTPIIFENTGGSPVLMLAHSSGGIPYEYTFAIGAVQTADFELYDTNGNTAFYITPTTLNLAVGKNNQSPLASLDVKPNLYTQPVASISGATGKATLLVDQSGVGDLFTASQSGGTRFTISANGNLTDSNYAVAGGIMYGTSIGLMQITGAGTGSQCLVGGATPSWGSCGTGTSPFKEVTSNGTIQAVNNTEDLLIGGTASASAGTTFARFGFLNVAGGTPTASISAGTAGGLTFTSTGNIQTTAYQPITIGGATTGAVNLGTNNGIGNVVIAPNAGGQSALIVNKQGFIGSANISQDIFTASAAGITVFKLDTGGNATMSGSLTVGGPAAGFPNVLGNFTGNTNSYLQVNIQNKSNGNAASSDIVATADNGTDSINYIDLGINSSTYNQAAYNIGSANDGYLYTSNGALTIGTAALKPLIFHTNGTTSSNEVLRLDAFGKMSLGTVGTNGGGNGQLVINQTNSEGNGDIFSASVSGTTKFIITNGGNLSLISGANIDTIGASGTINFGTGTTTSTLNIGKSGGTINLPGFATNNNSVLTTGASGLLTAITTTTSGQCLMSNASGNTPSWNTCPSSNGTSPFKEVTSNGTIVPLNNTEDFLIGGTASASAGTTFAKFGFINVAGGTPTASISAGLTGGLILTSSGAITTTAQQKITIGGSNAGAIALTAGTAGGGSAGLGITLSAGAADVGGVAQGGTVTINGGLGGGAGAGGDGGDIVIDAGSGSGLLGIGGVIKIGANITSGITLGHAGVNYTLAGLTSCTSIQSNGTGLLSCGSVGGGSSPFKEVTSNGTIVPLNNTEDFLIGGIATQGANFAKFGFLNVAGGTPTASISAGTAGGLTITSNGTISTTARQNLVLGSSTIAGAVNIQAGNAINGFGVTITAGNALGANTGGALVFTSGSSPSGTAGNVTIDTGGAGGLSGSINIGTANASAINLGVNGSTITFGSAGNTVTFTTSSGLVYAGNARLQKTITLSPEYAGAILTASGSATTNGSMTSDATSSATLASNGTIWKTHYDWMSTTASPLQDYTVAVRVTLPQDFSDWQTTAMTIDYNTLSTSNANNALDVYIYNPSATNKNVPVYFSTGNVVGNWDGWGTVTITRSQLTDGIDPDWVTAGQSAVIYLKMKAMNSNHTLVGDIKLNYLSKF